MTPEQLTAHNGRRIMDKKIAAMDLALSHIGMDVPEKTVREMAHIFLHALADDLPDEMVERGFDALMSDDRPVNEAFKDALTAALKGAA